MKPEQFKNGGVFIPSDLENSDWLLVALHGSGGSCSDFQGLESLFNIPEMNYLYLNGPIQTYTTYRWYTDDPSTRHDAYQYLNEAFTLIRQKGYTPDKCFLLGFSQGGALAFEFGVRYPHVLAGYISISGRIEGLPSLLNQGDPHVMKRGQWLATHGSQDTVLSSEISRDQIHLMQQSGMSITFQEYEKGHEFDAKNELPAVASWICSRMLSP